jgi:hypothetical protein
VDVQPIRGFAIVSDVNETLQQLLSRRLREIGKARGRDTPISLNQLYSETPDYLPSGERVISYEILRRVQKGTHSNLTGRAVRTLATMLGVPEGDVWQAAGRRAPSGRFELPERADRLNEDERDVVLSVVDAILRAGEGTREASQYRGSAKIKATVGDVSVEDYTLAARDADDDAESEAQQIDP